MHLLNLDQELFLQTYKRIPIKITHGEGVYLYSEEGKKYLDFFSGLAVNALGYGNKKIISAIEKQVKRFIHLSNYYVNPTQIKLAEKLIQISGLSKVFFTNSGTEATEASLKLIRKVKGPQKNIITFSNGFHGRTYGGLSLGGKEKFKKYFSPLLPNIIQLSFNDIEQLKDNINSNTAAVYLEFIQGEGGVRIALERFVEALALLKKEFDFVLVADEVQSGFGRTGKLFAYNHYDIEPDLVLIAKAIGGGLPLGALLTNELYSTVFDYGDHGSTFGGNPVSCAAGLIVLEEIFDSRLILNAEILGKYFLEQLKIIWKSFPEEILDVRGKGFMIGIEMNLNCSSLVDQLREKGILVNCTSENVIRILPPLISTKDHIDIFLNAFKLILN